MNWLKLAVFFAPATILGGVTYKLIDFYRPKPNVVVNKLSPQQKIEKQKEIQKLKTILESDDSLMKFMVDEIDDNIQEIKEQLNKKDNEYNELCRHVYIKEKQIYKLSAEKDDSWNTNRQFCSLLIDLNLNKKNVDEKVILENKTIDELKKDVNILNEKALILLNEMDVIFHPIYSMEDIREKLILSLKDPNYIDEDVTINMEAKKNELLAKIDKLNREINA